MASVIRSAYAVLHPEPGEDMEPVDHGDARGIEAVQTGSEQPGHDDLGHVAQDAPHPLSGGADAGTTRHLGDVSVIGVVSVLSQGVHRSGAGHPGGRVSCRRWRRGGHCGRRLAPGSVYAGFVRPGVRS
jgi:hypothetical protein